MTATLPDVAAKKEQGKESAEQRAAAELVRLAKEQGLSLTGPDGLLKQLTKTVLETALQNDHNKGSGSGRIRTGARPPPEAEPTMISNHDQRFLNINTPYGSGNRPRSQPFHATAMPRKLRDGCVDGLPSYPRNRRLPMSARRMPTHGRGRSSKSLTCR